MTQETLTKQVQRFVSEYVIDLNGRQAAIRAGYSEKTAQEQSSRLLSKVKVQDAITEAMRDRSERTEITADRVLLEIARLAFNDPRKAFRKDGSLKSIHEIPDEVAASISSIKVLEVRGPDGTAIGETKEIKFWDKGKQLDLAGKHLGLFNADTSRKSDLPEKIELVFTNPEGK